MRIALAFVALLMAAAVGFGQDLDRPIGIPGELPKELPEDVPRTASGRLQTPPPPPARPELNAAIEQADAEAIYRAWLRTQPAAIAFVNPQTDQELIEGDEVELTWQASGPIAYVRVSYCGNKCRLGGHDRGGFEGFITQKAPSAGSLKWKVPWLDATALKLRIAGLAEDGTKLGAHERAVRFRPRFMAHLSDKGTLIAISKTRQRLYYQKGGKIVREHIVSTAASGYWTPTMRPDSAGSHGAMGQVFYKSPNTWSRQYRVWMPYWLAITSSGSHGIHATSPGYYYALGSPASHGCVRQHRADARILYGMVEVGTAVYVFP